MFFIFKVRENSLIRLEDAIESHATLDLDLEIDAPYVIVPVDATRPNSIGMILDFGHLSIKV